MDEGIAYEVFVALVVGGLGALTVAAGAAAVWLAHDAWRARGEAPTGGAQAASARPAPGADQRHHPR
ncbi:MAG: hypothetical protein AB7G23_13360 [Vicinamibacterales bacterium]